MRDSGGTSCETVSQSSGDGDDPAGKPGQRTRPVRTLVTGYPALFMEGLREMVSATSGLTVVGEATTAGSATAMAAVLRPDVVLYDLDMPGGRPAHAVRRLRESCPRARIIALSTHEEPALLRGLSDLDVNGYLLKSVSRHELLASVLSAPADDERVTLSISRTLLTHLNGTTALLSRREREVLALAAEALSNAQIAVRLGIREGTVKRHLRNVFVKLGAVSRIDAVNKAIATSLISTPQSRRP